MSDIKQKETGWIREWYWLIQNNKQTEQQFVDDILHRIDLAIAEERKRIINDIEIFYAKKFNESKLWGTSNITVDDFINLITNNK